MFWTTKYTPNSLCDISSLDTPFFHKDISRKLQTFLTVEEECAGNSEEKKYSHPNICLMGSCASGKWTLSHLILEYLFGKSIFTIRKKRLQLEKGDVFEMNASPHHCEFNDTLFLSCKPAIFHKVIQSLGESRNICDSAQPYYILCKNINLWSNEYHSIIKQATEHYSDTLRFIVTTQKSLPSLTPFFATIRIPSPKNSEILECLKYIFENENYEYTTTIQNKILQKLKNSADNDYRTILLWCQEKMITGTWTNIKRIKKIELKHVASLLFSTKSLESLLQLKDMLIECISFGKIEKLPKYLIKQITRHPSLTNDIKTESVSIIAKFNSRMKLHHRNHIHYEGMIYELFHCIHKSR